MSEITSIPFVKNNNNLYNKIEIPEKLQDFLIFVDENYKNEITRISMFDSEKHSAWNNEQKNIFIKLFYHARGHFYKFLWCIGSRTNNGMIKNKVLENIQEEFGEEKKSHEKLYFDFSDFFGIDLRKEIFEEKFYLPFLRKFDNNHIKWIIEHDSEAFKLGLFSAYEKLDNIDYFNLFNLAKNIGVLQPKALKFFLIHSSSSHFERLSIELNKAWESNRPEVISAFELIYKNQLDMWNELSKHITEIVCLE